ncbi:MAG: helix-turn-helix transcriptional regulator [Lachnospiraceae bacterium]|nr:helix-turn-helix transcriptional regulator [Lachnospiraceae bacterium]
MYTTNFYEKKKHGTMKFPAAYYYVAPGHPQYNMPFHWHTEWELIRVKEDLLILHIDEEEIEAEEGDILMIRDSMFHGGALTEGTYECLVFDFYGLFHDIASVKEYVRPFYRLNLLPQVHYKCSEYPEICKIAAEIMDANYNYFEKMNNDTGFMEDGWRELATVGGLSRLFGLILHHGLCKENKMESVRSTHRISRIKNVLEYVEKHYQTPVTLGELAEVAGMNPQYFCRAFKEITMQSPMDYVIFYRLEQAVKLLSATDLSVMEVAMECGFNDCSYFIRVFKKQKGMTPNQYRKSLNYTA